jgi:hypothetical protein
MRCICFLLAAMAASALFQGPVQAQVVGTYDNFDCFNDTGETAEGFEIDVEDVSPSDLTRTFPSNFSGTLWVIRYGLPTVTAYDFTTSTPDPQHSYDAGHKGVLITYAATWTGSQWQVSQPTSPYGNAGNGTPYNPNPTITAGESCWWYGLGAKYPSSGCDHFGISFGPSATPGKISYHWKVPDPNNVGQLINWSAETSLPPSPTFNNGAGGAVQAVAQAPDNENEAYWGPAYFVKVTTIYAAQDAVLEDLQKVNIQKLKTKKTISYSVLQKPPAGQVGENEMEDVENDGIAGANVQVTKQYEYFVFAGDYDAETHEAVCDSAYKTETDALNGTNPIPTGDSCSIAGNYWVIDSYSDLPVYVKSNMGKYIGAHINADNIR